MNHYQRQIILDEIGPVGQERLATARVLCVGAGGLGCPALQYLTAAGVGHIGVIDFDKVENSNLHRQILFTPEDKGQSKAKIARDKLRAMNPEITITAYNEELTDKNAISLFSGYDIILDGTDNFSAKFLINDAAVKLGKPVIYGAIQQFEGQVAVFDAQNGPCYRCLHPEPPKGMIQNCAEAGVIGALAGIIGTMQAMEAIKLIVKHTSFKPLTGMLFIMDTKTMETRRLAIPKNPACPICSKPANSITPTYSSPVCAAPYMVSEIDVTETKMLNATFVDVRERIEWEEGHIEGAVHLPLSALQKKHDLYTLPETNACIIYCQYGARSKSAIEILQKAGFDNLHSLKGGYDAWLKAGA